MRTLVAFLFALIMMITLVGDGFARAQNLDSILLDLSKKYLQPNNMTLYTMEKNRPVDLSLLLGGYLRNAKLSASSAAGARLEQACTRYLGEVAQRANPVDQESRKRVSKELLVKYFKRSSIDDRLVRSIQSKYSQGVTSSSSSRGGLTYAPATSGSPFSDKYNPGSGSRKDYNPPATGLFTDGYNPGAKKRLPRKQSPGGITGSSKAKLLQKHDAITLLGERADGINRTPRQQPNQPSDSATGKLLQNHDAITAIGERADRRGTQRQTGRANVIVRHPVPPPYLNPDLILGTWTRYKHHTQWIVQKRGDSYIGYSVGPGPRKTFLVKEINHGKWIKPQQRSISFLTKFSTGQGKSFNQSISMWEDGRSLYLSVSGVNFKRSF